MNEGPEPATDRRSERRTDSQAVGRGDHDGEIGNFGVFWGGVAAHLCGEGFTEVRTSKRIGTGIEGGTGLFSVNHFDTTVFLAQSPQFYKQAMVASGLERVFEIGCAYRVREAPDPTALERVPVAGLEMAWIDSEQDLMDLEVRILRSIFRRVERGCTAELALWKATCPRTRKWSASRACPTSKRGS